MQEPGDILVDKKGLEIRRYANGWHAVRYHYSSHPDKGKDWAEREAQSYPGGLGGSAWRAEMEIDFQARSGEKVYIPPWNNDTHVIDPIEIPQHWPLFRAIDPGWTNPTAALWVAFDPEGFLYCFREYYETRRTIAQNSEAIRGLSGREVYDWTKMDPSAFSERPDSPEPMATQYAQNGIIASPADNRVPDGIASVLRWLQVRDDGLPSLFVFRTCRNLIFEMNQYHYQKIDPSKKDEKTRKEVPVKTHDHLLDCLRYIIQSCPDISKSARAAGYKRKTIHQLCWESHSKRLAPHDEAEDLSSPALSEVEI